MITLLWYHIDMEPNFHFSLVVDIHPISDTHIITGSMLDDIRAYDSLSAWALWLHRGMSESLDIQMTSHNTWFAHPSISFDGSMLSFTQFTIGPNIWLLEEQVSDG